MKREQLIEMFAGCIDGAEVFDAINLGYANSHFPREERLQWFFDFQNLIITDDDVILQNQKDVEAGISFRDDENGDEIPVSFEETRRMILQAQKISWR